MTTYHTTMGLEILHLTKTKVHRGLDNQVNHFSDLISDLPFFLSAPAILVS